MFLALCYYKELVIRNGARIIRPIMICVVGLLIIKIVFDMV